MKETLPSWNFEYVPGCVGTIASGTVGVGGKLLSFLPAKGAFFAHLKPLSSSIMSKRRP